MPGPPDTSDPVAMPGGVGNITRGEGVRRGVGFAAGFKNVCYSHGFDDFSTARVRLVLERGEPVAYVLTAAAEVGQGIVLVCEQIARTELGVAARHRRDAEHRDRLRRLVLGIAPDVDDGRRGAGCLS